jgi:NADH:ubiquinone oxidoreductase subunit 5 (subunit L)/multisubunit Na+/H+ antiporter MnhA subunit
MLINKIGDVAFLFSIAIILYVYGTVNIYELAILSDLCIFNLDITLSSTQNINNLNILIGFFFLCAAIGKSAQLGLHV